MNIRKIVSDYKSLFFTILLGFVIGWITYEILVFYVYSTLKNEIKNAGAFDQAIQQDPGFSGVLIEPGRLDGIDDRERTWRLLVNMNILEWDSSQEDVSKSLHEALQDLFKGGPADYGHYKALYVLTHLPLALGNDTDGTPAQNREIEEVLMEHLTSVLSEKKNARKAYQKYIAEESGDITPKDLEDTWNSEDVKHIVLNGLFLHFGVGKKFDRLDGTTREQYPQIRDFFYNVILNALENPDVVKAKGNVTLIEGTVQWLMSIFFCIGLCIIRLRFLYEKKSSLKPGVYGKQIRVQTELLKWIIGTMPALGFIGTLVGLSFALGEADSIVRAGSQVSTSMAIAAVTDLLKVAFTTTLIALVLSIILQLIKLFLFFSIEDENLLKDG